MKIWIGYDLEKGLTVDFNYKIRNWPSKHFGLRAFFCDEFDKNDVSLGNN
jgi:hypothetical protein